MHFDQMDAAQQQRLARWLSLVANQYRFDVTARDPVDERCLAESLAMLETRLRDLLDIPTSGTGFTDENWA
ncbi:hypothetical protein JYT71_00495 [Acidimicrobiaceae bacterium AH-315-P05]|nr:hypothetical protein [Acidimicrobiaceae bacterium AH-315-P05]